MMRIFSALVTLSGQWLCCALQVLLISSVLFAGVSSSVTVQELAASEETDSPFEEQEQEEEAAKFSEQQARHSKGNLRRWHHGDRSSFAYGRGTRRAIEGHCLANGLRAPLLH